MTKVEGTGGQRVSWAWVAGCLVLGAAGTGAAFITEAAWGWVGTAPAAFLQFGSTLFVAAVLFFVQRRFLREVRTEARALEQRLEARTSELESRLDQLTDATADAVTERHRSQDATLARLSDEVTFDTVTSALEESRALNAIDPFLFRVRASSRLDGLRVQFSWVDWENPDDSSEREFQLELSSPDPDTAAALSRRRVPWKPGQPAPAVGDAVVLMLEQEGLSRDRGLFDWGWTISALQRSLELAVAARRGDPEAPRLQGRLIELVNDEWMLTDAGIECPGRSFRLDEASFPAKRRLPAPAGHPVGSPAFEPEIPTWVAADVWTQLLRLGRLIYPIEPRSVVHDPGWRGRRRSWGSADGGVRGTAC